MMEFLSRLTRSEQQNKKRIKTYYSETAPISTSINVYTEDVFNILDGYSIKIHSNVVNSKPNYIIEMKICNDLILRYLNLIELYTPSRCGVPSGFKLGKADKFVGIEYCTRAMSKYPVRIGDKTFYKHDPSDFLFNDKLPKITLSTYNYVRAKTLFG